MEEDIYRQFNVLTGDLFRQVQPLFPDCHLVFRRNQVNVVRFQRNSAGYTVDRHGGVAGQQIIHQTFEIRGEVLDHHKGHAAIRGHIVEKLLQGV